MSAVSALTASSCALNAVTCALLAGNDVSIPDWFVSLLLLSAVLALLSLPFRIVRIFFGSHGGDKE